MLLAARRAGFTLHCCADQRLHQSQITINSRMWEFESAGKAICVTAPGMFSTFSGRGVGMIM